MVPGCTGTGRGRKTGGGGEKKRGRTRVAVGGTTGTALIGITVGRLRVAAVGPAYMDLLSLGRPLGVVFCVGGGTARRRSDSPSVTLSTAYVLIWESRVL